MSVCRRATFTALPETLAAILNLPDRSIESLAQRSYVHANGFLKLVLAFNERTLAAHRLHYWRHGSTGDSAAHSHPWPFRAVVHVGGYRHELYSASLASEGAHRWRVGTRRCPTVERIGRARLTLVAWNDMRQRDSYHLEPQAIHRLSRVIAPTVTEVCQGGHVAAYSNVYLNSDASPVSSDVVHTSPRDYRRHLKEVLDVLCNVRSEELDHHSGPRTFRRGS